MATKTPAKGSSTATKTNRSKTPASSESSALRDLFIDELKDIYWAEKQLTKALPKMKKSATSEALANALQEHLAVTEVHVQRLEDIFAALGQKPSAKKCEGMEGLIKEGESVISDTESGSATRDVGIIISAQKVEHYEIAAYGSLKQLAITLGEDKLGKLLDQTLKEEKKADELLSSIAMNDINYEAAEEDED